MIRTRRLIVSLVGFLLCLSAWTAAAHDGPENRPGLQPGDAAPALRAAVAGEATCELELELRMAGGDQSVPGVIRILTSDGRRVPLPQLLARSAHITAKDFGRAAFQHLDSWSVAPGRVRVSVPREKLVVEAFRGLDTVLARVAVDCTGREQARVQVPLSPLPSLLDRQAYASGNVHLHYKGVSREEADRYSLEVPPADDLQVLFLSFLNRLNVDQEYVSNTYTAEDLREFQRRSGVVCGYGEEYRHNFPKQEGLPQDHGYGHVMLLNLKQLILPASLGRSLMQTATDDGTLRPAIDAARAQGGTTLWCHNLQGTEDIPNWLGERLDAQVVFDQGSKGKYEDTFYRYLNVGLRVPFATGTDWFLRDMAQTWVRRTGELTETGWLDQLKGGRSFISNGPLLDLKVNGQEPGAVMSIDQPTTLTIEARAVGRNNFGLLELVINGAVVSSAVTQPGTGYFEAHLQAAYAAAGPCWIALRAIPFSGPYDKPMPGNLGFNEYGKPLFAHSTPVYVNWPGRGVFDSETALGLIDEMEQDKQTIRAVGVYSSDKELEKVLALYDAAIAELRGKLNE